MAPSLQLEGTSTSLFYNIIWRELGTIYNNTNLRHEEFYAKVVFCIN